MRQHIYRAWDNKQNKYIYDGMELCLLNIEDDTIPPECEAGETLPIGFKSNDRFIYEQYTGLKDKNGVKIFEGDIVDDQFQCGQLQRIHYSDDNACFEGDHIGGCLSLEIFSLPISVSPDSIKKGKVIGNIHENPELLTDPK